MIVSEKCLNFLYLLNDKVAPPGSKGGLEILNLLYELPGLFAEGRPGNSSWLLRLCKSHGLLPDRS